VDVSNQSVATTVIVLSNTSVGASSSDSDTKAVRYEGQLPKWTEWTRTSTLTSTPILGVPCFLRRNLVDNFVTVVSTSQVSASHGRCVDVRRRHHRYGIIQCGRIRLLGA
jgi:hypothetical protein